MARPHRYLLAGLKACQPQLQLLQTIPAIDEPGATMLLVEIGAEVRAFSNAERLAS